MEQVQPHSPNANTPGATVTVSGYGTKEFTWTETNGSCSDNDAVTINFYEQPTANAGAGGDECDLTFVLNATASVGTGVWTMTNGQYSLFLTKCQYPGSHGHSKWLRDKGIYLDRNNAAAVIMMQ